MFDDVNKSRDDECQKQLSVYVTRWLLVLDNLVQNSSQEFDYAGAVFSLGGCSSNLQAK